MHHRIYCIFVIIILNVLKFKSVGQPDLVTVTSGFTDFSTLLVLALVLLSIALDFRLDVTGMRGKGFASRLCHTLI